jgi:hypothetical protein
MECLEQNCGKAKSVKKPPSGGLKYEGSKPPLGPTVAPKTPQGNKNK